MKRFLFALLLVLTACGPSATRHARVISLDLTPDGEASLQVYLPDRPTGRAVLCLPGGAYAMLAEDNEGTGWAPYFVGRGITLAVLHYRLPAGDPSIPISDVEQAMRVLRERADEWGLNPHDIGIMGSSAGGHLASTAATSSPFEVRPDFQILFYPVITMGRGTHEGSRNNLLGDRRDDPMAILRYSSERQVRRHLTPPALLLLANDDRDVQPVSNAIAYYNAMRGAGNSCTLHIYPTGGHGFGSQTGFAFHQQLLDDMSAWLDALPSYGKEALRVACIGDSITDGHGIDMSEIWGYPALMQGMLGEGYQVRNFGVSARTMMNSGNYPYMNELAWQDALAFQPDIAVIKLGTNDSKEFNWVHKEDFAGDLAQMIRTLQALPSKPKIYLAAPIPAFENPYGIREEVIAGEIIPLLRQAASEYGLEFIDLHTDFTGHREFVQEDGVHPNAAGVRRIAEVVSAAIRR